MKLSVRALGAACMITLAAPVALAAADEAPAPAPADAGAVQHHHVPGMRHAASGSAGAPVQPGQAAFGAAQEIVERLDADPGTDWSRVDIDALREHLVDMDEVTMRAEVRRQPVDGGLRLEIAGAGRTLAAIKRMVPAHAQELDRVPGWRAEAETVPTGAVLTVVSGDPREALRIRGLGFLGLMTSGAHHQEHHLAIAKGEMRH